MAINAYPFDGGPNMAESEWRQLWRSQADGFIDVGSLTLSNSDGTVTLTSARGVIQGAAFIQTGSDNVTLTAVPGGMQRIDFVVLRYNPTANTVSLQVVTGTPATSSPQQPLLEPDRSGSSLQSGPYDVPVARFTGGPGTALQRGVDVRSRIQRTHFVRDPQADNRWGTVNHRHGDVRFAANGSWWYNSTSGNFERIVDTPASVSAVVDLQANEIHGEFGATFVPGSPQCSVSFVPGPSRAVKVTFGGLIYVASNGNTCLLSIQVRQGSTEIVGPHLKRAIVAGSAVTDSGVSYGSGDAHVTLTGLDEGVTYTARTMHWASVEDAGHILARRVTVDHAHPTS